MLFLTAWQGKSCFCYLSAVLAFAFLLLIPHIADGRTVNRNKLLVISFDGFRWDYPNMFYTPNLEYVARTGVHAPEGIITAFVTKTFPTHHSISTGLYVESHGIVDSVMVDSAIKKDFKMWNSDPSWWNDGEPIWITAQKRGLKSGIFFWPGSDVAIKGQRPTFYKKYSSRMPFERRVNTVVNWLVHNGIDLAMMYFNEPDHSGHSYGAASTKVEEMVEKVDSILGLTMKLLRDNDIYERVNILIVSDHGMINMTQDDSPFINLKNYIHMKRDVKRLLGGGPLATIIPQPGKLQEVYRKLKGAHPHMHVYLKKDVPERLHYKAHRRIHDIVLIADPGYDISASRQSSNLIGNHGYDNLHPSMKPIFYARGPDFKANYKSPTFETVNIYPLMCHLLGIPPAPNNGSLHNVAGLLKKRPSGIEDKCIDVDGIDRCSRIMESSAVDEGYPATYGDFLRSGA